MSPDIENERNGRSSYGHGRSRPTGGHCARARIGAGVSIGAYAVVGDDVQLGEGCILHPHAVVDGPARLGRSNVLHPFCRIGGEPQDLKYAGERTRLEVGDRNVFRECVTVSRGTVQGGGVTRIGNDNLIMTSAHIAHDCVVGDHTIFANGATLAGHVTVEDYSTIGAFSPVHQFCRIGSHAYIGASTVITRDVPPFSLIVTERNTRCFGVNSVGLSAAALARNAFAPLKARIACFDFETQHEPSPRTNAAYTQGLRGRR